MKALKENKWSVSFSVLVLTIALLEMSGFVFEKNLSGAIHVDYIPMAPSTSAAFIVIASSAIYLHKKKSTPLKYVILTFLSLVILYAITIAVGYLPGSGFHLENFLFPGYGYMNNFPLARMSPVTAVLLTFSGTALFLDVFFTGHKRPSKLLNYAAGKLTFIVFLIAFIFCLAYVYGTPLLYNSRFVIPMALTTALAFLFFSAAILLINKKRFPVSTLIKKNYHGFLLRNFLPLTVLPALFGGISVYFAFQLISINPAFISSAITILIAIVSGYFSNLIARKISTVLKKHKNLLRKSHLAIVKSEEKFRNLFVTISQGIIFHNAKGEIIAANPAAEKILGLSLEQMIGQKSIDPRWKVVDKLLNEIPPENLPAMVALQTGKIVSDLVIGVFNPLVDEYIWILVNSVPRLRNGKPFQVFSSFLDITPIYKAETELIRLKDELEQKVNEKTAELAARVAELELFHQVTIERELRMEDLRREIEQLKNAAVIV